MTVIEGVDYAFPPIPSPAALVTAGKKFAVRYGGKGTTDKMLDAGELASLRAAGIDVVANVEGAASGFRGYAAGQDYARKGRAWFKNLGMPDNRPIYYSADWDVTSADWADLKAALDGAASVDGRENVGLYGGRYAIQRAQQTGAARWFWQTYAWSGGTWLSGVHIQQYRNGVTIDGADCDLDRAMVADFGQWNYQEDTMTPQDLITALYNDLSRNPGTTDPNGQSGLNKLLRQFDREETAALLAPLKGQLAQLVTAVNALPKATADEVLSELAGRSVPEIAAALKAVLGDQAAAVGAALQAA